MVVTDKVNFTYAALSDVNKLGIMEDDDFESDDDRARVLLELGEFHRRRGEIRSAEVVWESVSSECAGSRHVPEALFRLAEREAEGGRWREAEGRYRRLIRDFGSSARGIQARDRLDAL